MKKLVTLAIAALFFVSCEHEPIEPEIQLSESGDENLCDSNKVYFQNDILPILVSSCAFSGCHDAGTAMGRVILTNYDKIIESDVIEAGKPEKSELYERIIATDINERMPLGGNPLPQESIEDIKQWILDGAQNTACKESTGCDTSKISFSGSISKILSQKCNGCHSGANPGGGINLTNYIDVKSIADNRRFLNAVLHTPGFKAMPLGGDRLPECEIETIRSWINQGAPNN